MTAGVGEAVLARPAQTAGHQRVDCDVCAPRRTFAVDRLDGPDHLVAHDERRLGPLVAAGEDRQIGSAEPGQLHADERPASFGRRPAR
jgi:hypothetical protein